MPGKNKGGAGHSFILAHEIYPETPVILLTSVKSATGLSFAATSADQQSWIKADRLIDKPVRPEQLKNELSRLLAHSLNPESAHPSGARKYRG